MPTTTAVRTKVGRNFTHNMLVAFGVPVVDENQEPKNLDGLNLKVTARAGVGTAQEATVIVSVAQRAVGSNIADIRIEGANNTIVGVLWIDLSVGVSVPDLQPLHYGRYETIVEPEETV